MNLRLVLVPLLLAGCADIPKDPEGTLDRVRAERSFKAAVIAGSSADGIRLRSFLTRVERASGARASIETGPAEPLLAKLETGAVDVVIGSMTRTSPWMKQVHVLPPLQEGANAQSEVDLVAMARNGENAWISLLHRQAEAVGQGE